MIPAEAVSAAEEAAHEAFVMWKWGELDHHESREFFTAILEAAAPHMLAEAQAQAYDKGYTHGRQDGELSHFSRAQRPPKSRKNPYRSKQ